MRATRGATATKYRKFLPSIPTPALNLKFSETKSLTDVISGSNLITFARSSTATYINASGVITNAAINEPRFEHDPSTGESLGLLVEESRRNLLLNSASLSTQSVTVTAAVHTLSFYGTGTIILSGSSTNGPLVGIDSGRVSLTFTPTAGTLTLTVFGTVNNAQLEAGRFATSYIPTTTSQVTRAADICSITGTNFSSWYNQNSGTLFMDLITSQGFSDSLSVFVAAQTTSLDPRTLQFGNGIQGNVTEAYSSGGYSLIFSGFTGSNIRIKMANAQQLNDVGFCANGLGPLLDASYSPPTVNRLNIGFINGFSVPTRRATINQITYWPTRLSDAILLSLTK